MQFEPKYFIDLGRESGIVFERHGNSVHYNANDEIPNSLGRLFVDSAKLHIDDLLDYLPDLDEPAFQLDVFKNL